MQNRRVRTLTSFCLMGALCLSSGCTTLNTGVSSLFSGGCMSDAIEKHRNRTCALKAWYRREHNFVNQPHLRDFKNGFIAGYMAIADGKPGCPPTLPPKEYWGWAYQTPEGRSKMQAWFAGYPYGIQAAKDDGLTSWNHIQLGPQFMPHNYDGSPGGSAYGQPGQGYGYPSQGDPMDGYGYLDTMPSGSHPYGAPIQAPDASVLQQGFGSEAGMLDSVQPSPFPSGD